MGENCKQERAEARADERRTWETVGVCEGAPPVTKSESQKPKPSREYWFRSRVAVPRYLGGETLVENDVLAVADSWRRARAKARYKVWRASREAGYNITFGEIKVTPSLMPVDLETATGVIW